MGLATTTLRVGVGALLVGHGLQKLGKVGDSDLDQTAAGFESMGFKPGKPYAAAAAVSETVGGGLLATGFHTPLGASMITGTMTVAIGKIHGKNGLWLTKGGMEYNLALIGAAFAVTEAGPGLLSVDGLLGRRRRGVGWAVAELVVGVAAGAAVVALSNRGASDAPAIVDVAADKVGAAASTVAGAANSVAGSAASVSSSPANGSGAAGHVGDAADKAAAKTAGVAAKAADKVGDVADKAAGKVSDSADKAAGKVADTASSAAGTVGNSPDQPDK